MKKTIFLLMAVCLSLLMLTSCSKDDDTQEINDLVGWWVDEDSPYFGYISDSGGISDTCHGSYYIPGYRINGCLHILNQNTVEYVSILYSEKGSEGHWFEYYIKEKKWYGCYAKPIILTYVQVDNKIILSNGNIYTIMDGKLIPDGSSGWMYKYR